MQKLYAFVDETGQDTEGALFIVVVIILPFETKEELYRVLTANEYRSGKNKRKWIKSRNAERLKYIDMVSGIGVANSIFYHIVTNTKAYESHMVHALAAAISYFCDLNRIETYKATIVIDGLKSTEVMRIGSSLRTSGVRTRRIRGVKDENSAIIRLADSLAGMVREAYEGRQIFKQALKKLRQTGILNEL